MAKAPTKLSVETLTHDEASRVNIPTAEYQSVMREEQQKPVRVTYERPVAELEAEKANREQDLDPQLIWRGKDTQDWSSLVVHAPPLFIQEKVHPKVLIDDLHRQSVDSGQGIVNSKKSHERGEPHTLSTNHNPLPTQTDLFADFNGIPEDADKTDFYRHEGRWSNRMILGDSLQVMASLAEREGLRGQVQCIYFDPPYGIKFNSNFQWSTTSRDVKDGKVDHITREPEQVKAFRDTWRDGIHSYLTYLRDRLTVARDLLTESGSIFVQIGDENVHRVRAVMDEVFGDENFVSLISFATTTGLTSQFLPAVNDYILWFAKNRDILKYRRQLEYRELGDEKSTRYRKIELFDGEIVELTEANISHPLYRGAFSLSDLTSSHEYSLGKVPISFCGTTYLPGSRYWSTSPDGIRRLGFSGRLSPEKSRLRYKRFFEDYPAIPSSNNWPDIGGVQSRSDQKVYVVQTSNTAIQRCILMVTDPGDLVLDPTCGSGTTAYVAEQWGRRWITIDTSRVALALARARLMGARYPYYLLADSRDGQLKEAELRRVDSGQGIVGSKTPNNYPLTTHHYSLKQGFVYERVPHITLKSIANNAEIDVIWEKFQDKLEPLREGLNQLRGQQWQEWEIPREAEDPWDAQTRDAFAKLRAEQDRQDKADPRKIQTHLAVINTHLKRGYTLETLPERPADPWPQDATEVHTVWWVERIARQQEIDASIAAKADSEYLYDKPYEDKKKVRVAGPFTVESLSPHRMLIVDDDDELVDSGQGIVNSKNGGEPHTLSTNHYSLATDSFVQMILENLKIAGVQQAHKADKINFTALTPWPGEFICAEGIVDSSKWIVDSISMSSLSTNPYSPSTTKRAAIFIGPEFGTVSRPDLVAAAREAGDAGFDVLIACAFNYDAHSSEFSKLGRIPILKARMNADLHMADDLKNTGKGNLFVIFGEPDIEVASEEWLVDSSGNWVAPYDIFKLISGIDRLAEINGLGREDLRDYARISNRREIWDYIANAAGIDIDSSKYRRRTSKENNRGVSTIAWCCSGVAGGTGNISGFIRKAGINNDPGFREIVERLRGNQQNVTRPNEVTIHTPLTTVHYSQATIHGVDVFHPNTGEVRSDGAEGIACWFIDTDYNEESFFVRHAYFLGANDPYKALKTTLKAEINEEAWATLNSDTSRPFEKPKSGRIAVKVINHLGDEVMKVFRVT